MKTLQLLSLSILSGLLLGLSWIPTGLAPMLFVAFVPLLIVEHSIFKNPLKNKTLTIFLCAFITFFTWNLAATWWIKNASFGGAVFAFVGNSVLMSIPFLFFHQVKKRIGEKWGSIIFVCFFIAFEYWHLDGELSWPWLTLGNAFADTPNLIQWYEYSGMLGGSLWILVTNALGFEIYKKYKVASIKYQVIGLISVIIIPISASYIISFSQNKFIKGGVQVVIVQPNIDPYNEKFSGSYEEQLNKMLLLAAQKTDSTTDYLVFPETAITEELWENQLEQSSSIQTIQKFLKHFPKLKIITGASTAKAFQVDEELSATARKFSGANTYYDAYNTALQLDNSGRIQIYHKSQLVAGVERMPFPVLFKPLEKFALDLGGTVGSLGTQKERTVFTSPDGSIKSAPVICYESLFGEFVSKYVQNGAQFIAIITNDGWWGDTPGYKQHLKYGRLRAIENRRWVVRSANTGTSCFITPLGEIQQTTEWWTPCVISQKIQLYTEITFYTNHGDYIGRYALYISLLLIIFSLLLRFNIINKFIK